MQYKLEVQSVEHYKAIISRLDDLGYDVHSLPNNPYNHGYIEIENDKVWWSRFKVFESEKMTLDDLYTDKLKLPQEKEYEVEVWDALGLCYAIKIKISGTWAASIYNSESYNETKQLIYLCSSKGVWKDENGNELIGHLSFEPK